MNLWEQALEQEASRIAIMRAMHFTVAARNIRRAVALGVSSRHEAALVLASLGYDDAGVARVLGTVADCVDGISGTWSDAPVWPQTLRFLRTEDPTTGELLYQRLPPEAKRFAGEFGDIDEAPVGTAQPEPEWWARDVNAGVAPDIDEPSVGDVDGYGRRG